MPHSLLVVSFLLWCLSFPSSAFAFAPGTVLRNISTVGACQPVNPPQAAPIVAIGLQTSDVLVFTSEGSRIHFINASTLAGAHWIQGYMGISEGVAVHPITGNIFIGDGAGSVEIYNSTGGPLTLFYNSDVVTSPFPQVVVVPVLKTKCLGLAIGADGSSFFVVNAANDGIDRVFQIRISDGELLLTIESDQFTTPPRAIAVDSIGNIYVASSDTTLSVFSGIGFKVTSITTRTGVSAVVGVAVDGAGNVYFADGEALWVLDGQLKTLHTFTTGLTQPVAVTLLLNGEIAVADKKEGIVILAGVSSTTSLDRQPPLDGAIKGSNRGRSVTLSKLGQ